MVKAKVKHKPPSRIRYEKKHPTISFRLDADSKARLREVLEKESFASFIKEAIGKREREKETVEEAHDKGYKEGYQKGYRSAYDEFAVYAPCQICGESLVVGRAEDKKKIAHFMASEGWCHASCVEARDKYRR